MPSTGTHQTGRGGPAYFSINNGSTALQLWNDYISGATGEDFGDWANAAS